MSIVRFVVDSGPALGTVYVFLAALAFGWTVTGTLLVVVWLVERFVLGLAWSLCWPVRLARRRR